MKLIYIAGPYNAETPWATEQNIRVAEEIAFEVARCGTMPVCPHTMSRFWAKTLTEDFWIAGTMQLMRKCDGVVMIPNWTTSSGSMAEYEEACTIGLAKHVYKDFELLQDWLRRLS
jgi:hypothetical protein